jgi:hypothetical protein
MERLAEFLVFIVGLVIVIVFLTRRNREKYQTITESVNPIGALNDFLDRHDYLKTHSSIFNIKEEKTLEEYFKKEEVPKYESKERGLPPFDQLSRDFIPIKDLDLEPKEPKVDKVSDTTYYTTETALGEAFIPDNTVYNNEFIENGGKFLNDITGFKTNEGIYMKF